MALDEITLAKLAERLHQARLDATELAPLAESYPALGIPEAYEIQRQGIALRRAAGEKVVGFKMGLTSKAKREQMNLHSPVYGVLTDRMLIANGARHTVAGSIHPKIEPEIAFITKKPLKGNITPGDVLTACSSVCAALEILDSRYKGFRYFSLPDVIADNSSSSLFVLGEPYQDFRKLDLANLNLSMKVNGEIAQSALSNTISGNPVVSVVELARLLAETGEEIPTGSIILAGAATTAVALITGMRIELEVPPLPGVTLHIAA